MLEDKIKIDEKLYIIKSAGTALLNMPSVNCYLTDNYNFGIRCKSDDILVPCFNCQ